MDVALFPQVEQHDDSYWYRVQAFDGSEWRWFNSFSWSVAQRLANFFYGQGSYFRKYISSAVPGDVIFANWRRKDDHTPGSGFYNIDHVGVITKVNGGNIYITQHTHDRMSESLYRQAGRRSWFAYAPHLQVWIAIPSRKA